MVAMFKVVHLTVIPLHIHYTIVYNFVDVLRI
jgi:hypothetical protein